MKLRALLATLWLSFLCACSGAGGSSLVPQSSVPTPSSALNVPSTSLTPSATTIAIPSGVVSTQGTVAGVSSTGVTLDQGYPYGKIPVTIPSTAIKFGGSIVVGSYLQVTGTGSVHTGISATVTSETASAPVSMSVTGTVVASTAYGFTLDVSTSNSAVPIVLNSSVVISGSTLQPGATATVTGPGTLATSITPTKIAVVAATPAPLVASSPIAIPSGAVSTQGKVAGVSSSGVTLDQGYPNGKIPVTIPSTAAKFGGAIVTGVYLQVTGTGSVHSGITATVVSETAIAPASITATGTIVAGTAYGFTLNVSTSNPAVPIVLNPSVVIAGGTLLPGATATVTGPGTLATSITPLQIVVADPTPTPAPNSTPSPTPAPIAQTHLLSGDYLGGYWGTKSITWSAAAPYINWATTSTADASNIAATGIKTMLYTIPNRTQSGDPMYTTDETTFAHDCNGNRITDVFNGITQYVMNVPSSSLWTLYHNITTSQIGSAHFDAVFQDDAGPLPEYNISPLPCSYSDSAWETGGGSLSSAAPRPVIINGLSSLNGHDVSPTIAMVGSNANTIGGNFEHCYSDNTQPKDAGWFWTAVENSELQIAAQHKLFFCMLRDTSSATTQTDERMYALASFLLTYDPSTSVIWEEFATATGFHAMPEQALVPLDPIAAQPTSVTSLAMSGGAYGREYQHCYIAGKFVSSCAVAVNPNPAATATFPFPQYTHTLVLNGSGVLDGGSIATNGAAAPTTMPALSAYVVFP